MDLSHRAKYMVLLGPTDAPRALLFNGDHHYLAEVSDRVVLDQLMKSSRVCPAPRNLMLDGVTPSAARGATDAMRCFALG